MASWIGLRRADRSMGWSKGTAFRRFKAQSAGWVEGRDYRLLDHRRDAAEIEALKAAGESYAQSVNVVLLAPAAACELGIAVEATPARV